MFIGGACSRPYRVDPPRAKKLRGNSTARGSKCALAVFRRWAHRAARRKAAHPPWGCPIGRPWVWEHPRLPQHGATREHNAPPERLSGSRRASQIHPEYTGSTPNTWVYTRTPGCTPRCSSVHPGVWSTPGVLRVYLRSAARAAQALRRRVVLACCAMLGQPWMFPDPGAAYGAAPRRVRGLSSRRAVRPTSKNRQCALRAPRGRVSAQLFGPRRVDAVRA